MRFFYCSWAVIALLVAPAVAQAPQVQQAPPEQERTYVYVIFVQGTPVGREEITTRVDGAGTTITSRGRTAAPVNTTLENVEIRYDPQGSPESLVVDGLVDGEPVVTRTRVRDGSATTQRLAQGKTVTTTHPISPNAIVLSNGIFAPFSALAQRLAAAPAGTEFRVLVVPDGDARARLSAIRNEQMQTGATIFNVRRYDLAYGSGGAETPLSLTVAADGSLLRISIPAQSMDVLREDIAGVNTRTSVYSNPGDQRLLVPSLGFNLGATITLPATTAPPPPPPAPARTVAPARTAANARSAPPAPVTTAPPEATAPAGPKSAAVVLVAGRESPGRDAISVRTPAMAQLAGALSKAGIVVVRYDNRGTGQSGGRTESATIADYAEDARAVVKWLASRKDVDPKRIAMVGHGDGAWMAMLAASREKRISAVITLASPSSTGEQLLLEQQRRELDEMKLPPAERAAKEALQKQVHAAVLTGKGWQQLPEDVRAVADTPWFQSVLAYDPAKVVGDISAPILVIHGELDREVPVAHAERLVALAQKGKSKSVSLVTVRGINHLLVPAFTGNVSEYPALIDRNISSDVTSTVTSWLANTLPAPARGR